MSSPFGLCHPRWFQWLMSPNAPKEIPAEQRQIEDTSTDPKQTNLRRLERKPRHLFRSTCCSRESPVCDERAHVVMDVLFHLFSPFTPVGVAVHFFAVRVTISKKLMAANQTGNVKQRGQNVNQTNHILNLSSYARLSQKGLVRSSSACANGFVKTCIYYSLYSL